MRVNVLFRCLVFEVAYKHNFSISFGEQTPGIEQRIVQQAIYNRENRSKRPAEQKGQITVTTQRTYTQNESMNLSLQFFFAGGKEKEWQWRSKIQTANRFWFLIGLAGLTAARVDSINVSTCLHPCIHVSPCQQVSLVYKCNSLLFVGFFLTCSKQQKHFGLLRDIAIN